MCDEHQDPIPPALAAQAAAAPGTFTRRTLIGGALSAVAVHGLGLAPSAPAARAMTGGSVNDLGEQARIMAMHVHSSFSEGSGSMEAQLAEAALAGVDALWWTDHDWRVAAAAYRSVVHFDSLTRESEAGAPWKWTPVTSGTVASKAGGIVSAPTSPNDPSPIKGALQTSCVSAGAAEASFRWFANENQSRLNARGNVGGLTVSIEVLPQQVGVDSWLEMLVQLSQRPPAPGRPPTPYLLSYRFGPVQSGLEVRGNLGIVWVPLPVGDWSSVTVQPQTDIAALWPDIEAADNSFSQLWLGATSRNGASASGCFDFLRFQRAVTGEAALSEQRNLMSGYASQYSSVLQLQGLELSYFQEHLNWFGGTPAIPDSSTWTRTSPHVRTDRYVIAGQQAALIHAGGGLASLNHPFGTSSSATTNPQIRRSIAMGILKAKPGLDLLEVGYQARGADLRGHLDLWDTLLRNGLFLTGTGVSDDHQGAYNSWTKTANRFATGAWTTTLDEPALLTALAGGRAFCRELGSTPALDLSAAGGSARMGQVVTSDPSATIDVTVIAIGLPQGSNVHVVQGAVEPGSAALDPSTSVVQTLPATSFIGGSATVLVDHTRSSFVRIEVTDSTMRCIAFSNPVWLLTSASPTPAPLARTP
jgi:hypothetical protein